MPFVGYREPETVAEEENDDKWSEITYNEEKEQKKLYKFVAFLVMIL